MALTVKYNNAALPEGQPVDIGGVLVENGGSVELTREQEDTLVSRVGMLAKDYFKDSEDVEVSGNPFLSQSDLDERFPAADEEEQPVNTVTPPVGVSTETNTEKEGGD